MSRITHFSNKGVFLLLLGYCLLVANFVELRKSEVRRILIVSSRGCSGEGIGHERRPNPRA